MSTALQEADQRDLRRAARALLRRPLLLARDNPEVFRVVRQQATPLRDWFEQNTGWRLHIDAEVARLFKRVGAAPEGTHAAREPRSELPFGRRRYVLLCLALSVLERADQQITLGRLADGIIVAASDERLAAAGVTFELSGRGERADLVAVVRILLELGVLARVAGDEEAFMRDAGDVLYDVERRVMAVLISAARGASTITGERAAERMDALVAEAEPASAELRNRATRHRLMRSLLDEPVLYYDELTEDERTYLSAQRSLLTGRVGELTGLVPEIRAEGIAMVDPRDELTDVRMPEIGTDGHVALLISEELAAHARDVSVEELRALVRRLAQEHSSYWRRNTREPGAEAGLVEQALERLVALRLVRREGDRVHPLPA
ncbi:MAG: TIGR02678 family protein, partial [Acidobacteriota bacterium]|nr:TIGR02678 family protein [Acidobacteriota bacterium]